MIATLLTQEQQQAVAVTTHLRNEVQGRILQFLATYLETAHLVNQINQQAIALGQITWNDLDGLRQHFYSQINTFKTLSTIQVGTANGDYVGILRLENGAPTYEIKSAETQGNKYVYALDAAGNPTATCIGSSPQYNPLARPWYRQAVANQGPCWSDIYQYSSSASIQLGMMGVVPVYQAGTLQGVFGCDVALTHISQFLATLNVSSIGASFIIDRSGYLIASSVLQRPFLIQASKATLMHFSMCQHPLIHMVAAELEQYGLCLNSIQDHYQFECEKAGQLYLIDINPIQDDYGLDWLVVTNLPVAELYPRFSSDAQATLMEAYSSLLRVNQSLVNQIKQKQIKLKQSEQDLQHSEERWQLALSGTNDGIWDWHIETNEVFFSERWQRMLGYEPGELTQHFEEWKQRIHPDDFTATLAAMQAHFERKTDYYVAEYRSLCQDGSYKWVLDRGRALWNEHGQPVRMVGSRTDITARKEIEAKLTFQAHRDALTGLLNRSALLDYLGQLSQQSSPFAVLFIDLDNFKVINDSLGHAAGDRFLQGFARAIESLSHPHKYVVARLSGDEFVVILEKVTHSAAAMPAIEHIQETLQQLNHQLGYTIQVTASIGITSTSESNTKTQNLLQDADIAMYAAKHNGGNQYVIFAPQLRRNFFKHLTLEVELRQALSRGEFEVYYQPIISLQTLALVGFEALIRWQHPERGLLSPAEFITVAEDKGLIVPIGYWVIEAACQQLRAWQQDYALCLHSAFMNVNVSVKQFSQPDFVDSIYMLLASIGIAPAHLQLEITESCMMTNTDLARRTLNDLNQRDIQICIDDFGTGYSSLSHLHQFPVQSLKIDRSFIQRIPDDQQAIAVVKAILALSQSLGICVTAEGIENRAQLDQIRSFGCELGQGYLFAKPGNAATISNWLATLNDGIVCP